MQREIVLCQRNGGLLRRNGRVMSRGIRRGSGNVIGAAPSAEALATASRKRQGQE